MKRLLAAAILLAAGGAAWPQAQAPAPEKQPPAPDKQATQPQQPQERRPLNLRLDDPSKYSRDEGPADKSLPALGAGDGRAPERTVGRSSPFPKDTNPGH